MKHLRRWSRRRCDRRDARLTEFLDFFVGNNVMKDLFWHGLFVPSGASAEGERE
jgi:hypothetical protein